MTRGFSVNIHLVDGKPSGLWHVAKKFSSVLAMRFSRADWPRIRNEPDFDATGVYVLNGEHEKHGPLVYVGEADSLAVRVTKHVNGSKDWWDTAVCFTTTDTSYHKGSARHLEAALIQVLREAGHELENRTGAPGARLSRSEQDDMERVLEEILLLLPILGIRVAGPKTRAHDISPEERLYHLKVRKSDARGIYSSDGFTVLEGSIAAPDTTTEFVGRGYEELRKQLIDSEIIENRDGNLVFAQDYVFRSPSAAACVVAGRTQNGWKIWKDEKGNTLDENERQDVAS